MKAKFHNKNFALRLALRGGRHELGNNLLLPRKSNRHIELYIDTLLVELSAKLQNTPQLIWISLTKNKVYCIPTRSSKNAA